MPNLITTTTNIFFTVSLLIAASCKTGTPVIKPALPDTVPVRTVTAKKLLRDSIPAPSRYVNDYERIFAPAEIEALEVIIKLFEEETTIQIAIITLDSTMTTAATLDATTLQIANAWSVGQKDENNGIVVGLSKHYRKMRIENGKGIAKILTDAETKKIIDEDFIPLFKQGKYFEGVKKGLFSLTGKLRKKYTA